MSVLQQIIVCMKKPKWIIFIKLLIITLGCLLISFLLYFAVRGNTFERRSKDHHFRNEKLIQIQKYKRLHADNLTPALEHVEDGSGHFADVDKGELSIRSGYKLIPILSDQDNELSDEQLGIHEIDNRVSGTHDAPAVLHHPADDEELVEFKGKSAIEELFGIGVENGIQSHQSIEPHLLDIDGQPSNWLNAQQLFTTNDNDDSGENESHDIHLAMSNELSAGSPIYQSGEQLFEVHFNELFNDDDQLMTASEEELLANDDDDLVAPDDYEGDDEDWAMSLDENLLDELTDHVLIAEEKVIEKCNHNDHAHVHHVVNNIGKDNRIKATAAVYPNGDRLRFDMKKHIGREPKDHAIVPSILDTLLNRMSLPFFTTATAPAPTPAYKILRLQPNSHFGQNAQFSQLNHLANFKDSPLKDDHLKLETSLPSLKWRTPNDENRRPRRPPAQRKGPPLSAHMHFNFLPIG